MGEVLLGTTRSKLGFQKKVAIKTVRTDYDDLEDYRTLFFDEAHLAARLNHPNLCQVFDFGEDKGRLYLVMEFADGLSVGRIVLQSQLMKKGIPEHFAARIVAQAARGLHSAHTLKNDKGENLNVVHRDVSPQNIIVTYDGAVKVLDFGIARSKQRRSVTQMGMVRGKPGYMAPEQARGEEIDHRADIFQLGTVLFELLTGDELFVRDSVYASIHAVINDPVPQIAEQWPSIHPSYIQILERALCKEKEGRFATADEMAWALDQVIASSQTQVTDAVLAQFLGDIRPTPAEKPFEQNVRDTSTDETTQLLSDNHKEGRIQGRPEGQQTSAVGGLAKDTGRDEGRPTAVLDASESPGDAGRPEGQKTSLVDGEQKTGRPTGLATAQVSVKAPAGIEATVLEIEEKDGFLSLSKEYSSDSLNVPASQPSKAKVPLWASVGVGFVILVGGAFILLDPFSVSEQSAGKGLPTPAETLTESSGASGDISSREQAGAVSPTPIPEGRADHTDVQRTSSSTDEAGPSEPHRAGDKTAGEEKPRKRVRRPTEAKGVKDGQGAKRRARVKPKPKGAKTEKISPAAPKTEHPSKSLEGAVDGASAQRKPDETRSSKPGSNSTSTPKAVLGTGWVTIQANPYGYVVLDGKRIGITPVIRHALPEGQHVVEIYSPDSDKLRKKERITVIKGKTKKVLVRD